MDFMFEDEVDEVGSDVEAYCPKCKADTTHVVISKYEDEIRRVQCNACGDVHSFRKPRGDVEDDVPEPIAAKKRASVKKANWEEFFTKHGEKPAKPYEFRERYTENTIVTHPKFGKGFVSEIISDSKVEISFKDGRRVLVHNRRDMPGLPLAAEGDGVPSTGGKAKALKEKAEKQEKAATDRANLADKKAAKAKVEAEPGPAKAPKTEKAALEKVAGKPTKPEPKVDAKPEAKVEVKAEAKPEKSDKADKEPKLDPDHKVEKADKADKKSGKPETKEVKEAAKDAKGGKDAKKASKSPPPKPAKKKPIKPAPKASKAKAEKPKAKSKDKEKDKKAKKKKK